MPLIRNRPENPSPQPTNPNIERAEARRAAVPGRSAVYARQHDRAPH
jgi:hypothetical protein